MIYIINTVLICDTSKVFISATFLRMRVKCLYVDYGISPANVLHSPRISNEMMWGADNNVYVRESASELNNIRSCRWTTHSRFPCVWALLELFICLFFCISFSPSPFEFISQPIQFLSSVNGAERVVPQPWILRHYSCTSRDNGSATHFQCLICFKQSLKCKAESLRY